MIITNLKKIYIHIQNVLYKLIKIIFYFDGKYPIYTIILSIIFFLLYITIITLLTIYLKKLGNNWPLVVELHNKIRATHNVGPLEWDDNLAIAANKWIKNCYEDDDENNDFYVNGQIEHAGENFAKIGKKQDCYAYDEKTKVCYANYNYKPASAYLWNTECLDYAKYQDEIIKNGNWNSLPEGVDVGHFTQQVWKTTNKIGCAAKQCNTETIPGDLNYTGKEEKINEPGSYNVSCFYYPPGNVVNPETNKIDFASNVLNIPENPEKCHIIF